MDSRGIGNYIEVLEAGGAIFATTAASTISVTGQTIDRSDYLSGAFFAGFLQVPMLFQLLKLLELLRN